MKQPEQLAARTEAPSAFNSPRSIMESVVVEQGSLPPKEPPVRGGVRPTSLFPCILLRVLDQAEVLGISDICSWQPHGRAFRIHDKKRFEVEVLPKYFAKQARFASFQRQLNLYGFLRLCRPGSVDRGAYHHDRFLRGRGDLCMHMMRTRVRGNRVRQSPDLSSEPNLAILPPMPPAPEVSLESPSLISESFTSNTTSVRNNGQPMLELSEDSEGISHFSEDSTKMSSSTWSSSSTLSGSSTSENHGLAPSANAQFGVSREEKSFLQEVDGNQPSHHGPEAPGHAGSGPDARLSEAIVKKLYSYHLRHPAFSPNPVVYDRRRDESRVICHPSTQPETLTGHCGARYHDPPSTQRLAFRPDINPTPLASLYGRPQETSLHCTPWSGGEQQRATEGRSKSPPGLATTSETSSICLFPNELLDELDLDVAPTASAVEGFTPGLLPHLGAELDMSFPAQNVLHETLRTSHVRPYHHSLVANNVPHMGLRRCSITQTWIAAQADDDDGNMPGLDDKMEQHDLDLLFGLAMADGDYARDAIAEV